MKNRFIALLILLVSIAPVAQAADAGPPAFMEVFTNNVKLGQQATFETGLKELWAALKETGADFPITVRSSGSSPGSYVFLSPLNNMADLDKQNAAFGKAFAKLAPPSAEDFPSWGNSSQTIRLRQDLSYQPENPRLKEGEAVFAYVVRLYVLPPNVPAVAKALASMAALNKKHNIGDPMAVFQNASGEGPMFGIRFLAKSQADHFAQVAKNEATMGDAPAAIRNGVGPMLKRIEYSWSFARPDLDYQP
jgi:hypothetical protein